MSKRHDFNKITIAEAEAKGFTVDTHCYPHFGYKGSRFRPDESVDVYTELESNLIQKKKDSEPIYFWIGPGGSLLCDCCIEGVQILEGENAVYYGGRYMIGETIGPKMADKIAILFGGQLRSKPPKLFK